MCVKVDVHIWKQNIESLYKHIMGKLQSAITIYSGVSRI